MLRVFQPELIATAVCHFPERELRNKDGEVFHTVPERSTTCEVKMMSIESAFCRQVVFQLFDETLLTLHIGYGHLLQWRLVEQAPDGMMVPRGKGKIWGFKDLEQDKAKLIEAFNKCVPKEFHNATADWMKKAGVFSK